MTEDYIYWTAPKEEPTTYDRLKEMVDKIKKFRQVTLCGISFEPIECAALAGTNAVLVIGEKGYFWPDIINSKEVKIIELPELLASSNPDYYFK